MKQVDDRLLFSTQGIYVEACNLLQTPHETWRGRRKGLHWVPLLVGRRIEHRMAATIDPEVMYDICQRSSCPDKEALWQLVPDYAPHYLFRIEEERNAMGLPRWAWAINIPDRKDLAIGAELGGRGVLFRRTGLLRTRGPAEAMCNLTESTDDDPVVEKAFTDAVKAVVPREIRSAEKSIVAYPPGMPLPMDSNIGHRGGRQWRYGGSFWHCPRGGVEHLDNN